MVPTLEDGDQVILKRTKTFQIGDIVLANHPYKNARIVKRIREFSTAGKLFITGDNPHESSDSQTFGEISEKDVLGKIVCRLK